jgi:hypothetical protein
MHLARAVAAELLIGLDRPPSDGPAEPAVGCRNGRRRTPLPDWLNRSGSHSRPASAHVEHR